MLRTLKKKNPIAGLLSPVIVIVSVSALRRRLGLEVVHAVHALPIRIGVEAGSGGGVVCLIPPRLVGGVCVRIRVVGRVLVARLCGVCWGWGAVVDAPRRTFRPLAWGAVQRLRLTVVQTLSGAIHASAQWQIVDAILNAVVAAVQSIQLHIIVLALVHLFVIAGSRLASSSADVEDEQSNLAQPAENDKGEERLVLIADRNTVCIPPVLDGAAVPKGAVHVPDHESHTTGPEEQDGEVEDHVDEWGQVDAEVKGGADGEGEDEEDLRKQHLQWSANNLYEVCIPYHKEGPWQSETVISELDAEVDQDAEGDDHGEGSGGADGVEWQYWLVGRRSRSIAHAEICGWCCWSCEGALSEARLRGP